MREYVHDLSCAVHPETKSCFFFKADRISHFLNPGETPPSMLYDRTDDEEMLTLPNSTTSECVSVAIKRIIQRRIGLLGFDGVILEATQSAQVVSVTLF